MKERILDDFESLSGWTAFASGEAQLDVSLDRGRNGNAMRLDFDFHGGGGFVGVRKAFTLELPESYSFCLQVRGAAASNIFEFKLVDESNLNVWRYRVEAFDFSEEWRPVCIRNSRIEFAWGPLGGGPARHAAAVELVIAAGPGGRGAVWIADLRFRDETYRSTPLVRASSFAPGHQPQFVLNPNRSLSWRSEASDGPQWLLMDFQQEREYGGLIVEWEKDLRARRFDVEVSADGRDWDARYSASHTFGERSYVYLPHTLSRYVRLNLYGSAEGLGCGIRRIDVEPYDFSRTINHFFQNVAREQPAGLYPKHLLGRQTYWTPVGTGRGDGQALFNEEGMVEVDKGTFSIAPFLYAKGRLVTWADAAIEPALMRGFLPIPSSKWRIEGLIFETAAFADGEPGRSVLYIRYRLENLLRESQTVALFAAIVPFQVTPAWQNWRSLGGVSPIHELSRRNDAVRVDGDKIVVPLADADFGAAAFAEGGTAAYLPTGDLPPRSEVKDDFGYASGALRFELELPPGSTKDVYLAVPFGSVAFGIRRETTPAALKGVPDHLARAARDWESRLGAVELILPPRARSVSHAFKTAAAHILINRDGPALHPGPRRYARSWIRDGAVMGAALLRLGINDPIRDFIRWYSDYQAEDGKLPDCVDWEGAEWLPEYDAYGQFIYAVMEYWRFTGDKEFLKEMRPAASKALAYMEALRTQRLTEEYRNPKNPCYGLLPQSMSHEGYMAHPVHAFWDDFWALRGFKDAEAMADVLGDGAEAVRLSELRDAFCRDLRASLSAVVNRHGIDFLPGSVEFGDFDPAASAVAVALLNQLHLLPRPETDNTFEKYLTGFRERAGGKRDWNNYSAYEIRIIGALVRLGRRREALELMRFMMADRRIPPWNQWPEISWRDPSGPSFMGDLPHSWIGGEYILAVSGMFAYEREADDCLVVAAGLSDEWLADGLSVGVENLPTYYGKLSYRMRLESEGALRLHLDGDLTAPRGGIIVCPPLPQPIGQVEGNGKAVREFQSDCFKLYAVPAEVVVRF